MEGEREVDMSDVRTKSPGSQTEQGNNERYAVKGKEQGDKIVTAEEMIKNIREKAEFQKKAIEILTRIDSDPNAFFSNNVGTNLADFNYIHNNWENLTAEQREDLGKSAKKYLLANISQLPKGVTPELIDKGDFGVHRKEDTFYVEVKIKKMVVTIDITPPDKTPPNQ